MPATEGLPQHAAPPPPPGEGSFAALFAAVYGRLWLLASALIGDRTEAEDLVQEAALVGMQKFSTFEPDSNFSAWMSQIVRYQAQNWRSKSTRRRTQPAAPETLDSHRGPSDAAEPAIGESREGGLGVLREGFDQEVVAALEAVAATPRACLLLRVVHELTYAEIGEMLGIPEGTAMSHVHRTRARIRGELSGRTKAEKR